ncbi:Serine/threonine-protein kinase PknL [Roseimaritima multifibrata]|uniref:Serine/threonine-protein kinase PknL n=1 Tax=Roseimaritima multifibrata TaxID=1930274 RepID=A0A517MH18_9BACT|nr:serine/threonine-protein kinase [Roseimaritima multifibrata]QDS94169.1 Serine/threonine-protein kinase PknL [Roseimaritima multifibrata]
MARSRLGPLALESPLGQSSGTSGYWRAVHIEQRRNVAVKMFSIPFGGTPETKREFMNEWETLKKLRQPAIARCYGGGFEGKDAYLAYEMIEGESLSEQVESRGPLPWQAVLDLADPLTEALAYAHDRRVVHGGLEPDKIRMAGLSPVIVDFRAERATSVFRVQRPPTIEDFAYRAPELIQDPGAMSPKCDLYSLGGILFYALTGRHPITGSTPEELAENAVHQVPPNVSTEVFDCPTFLSAVVEQLLQKEPVDRPHGADAVRMAIREVRRRSAAGTGVAEHVSSGFSPLKVQADSKEARELLGRAELELREPVAPKPPLWERAWFLSVMLVLLCTFIGWVLWPPSESQLRARAEKLLAEGGRINMGQAKSQCLEPLVRRFPDGENADWARDQIDQVEMVETDHALSVKLRRGMKLRNEAERRYADAQRFEQFGDPSTAIDKYRSLVTLFDNEPDHRVYVNLARRQIAEIESQGIRSGEAERILRQRLSEADKLMQANEVFEAKEIWNSILELYGDNDGVQPLVLIAEDKLEALKRSQ